MEPPWWGAARRAIAEVAAVAGARVQPAGPPRPDSPGEWAADPRAGPLLTNSLVLFQNTNSVPGGPKSWAQLNGKPVGHEGGE